MKATGKVDARFQSYNIEMVEVIGGRFWRPYTSTPVKDMPAPAGGMVGLDPALFEQRSPIDLRNPRLRKLAAALGPAYLRVSGSWANSVYFQDSEQPAPAKPPSGFNGVLTRAEWKGVADFARAVDARIVTSFSGSAGTRDAAGVWTPAQAEAFLRYSKQVGAPVAAAEFLNEPNFPLASGMAPGYNGAAYGRDFAVFQPVFRKEAPGALLLGPGSVGEGFPQAPASAGKLQTEDLLKSFDAAKVDAFSYHLYPAVSERCAAHAPASSQLGTEPETALSDDFLQRTDAAEQFYAGLRDTYAPGKPMWLTETGQSACGGDRWAATFFDSFRYLYQLGTLARRNVQVVMHNTLAASDYGLIDEASLQPRPNYWAALLWHRLMGSAVLNPGPSPSPTLKVFAQCTAGKAGSVTLLLLNVGRAKPASISIPAAGEQYRLTAATLQEKAVLMNGTDLALTAAGDLPALKPLPVAKGVLTLPAASISFVVVNAGNGACR